MNTRSNAILVTLGLIAAVLSNGSVLAQGKLSASPEAVSISAPSERVAESKMRSAAAQSARSLQASPDDIQALASALKAGDDAQAKAILSKHGFTPEQLAGAQIALNEVKRDNATGQAARGKITIGVGVSFKPLKITVTVTF